MDPWVGEASVDVVLGRGLRGELWGDRVSLAPPPPSQPRSWSLQEDLEALHCCSQENTFVSDPEQEEGKGERVGTRWLCTEGVGWGGVGLDSSKQIMPALDCPSVKCIFLVPLPLF